MPWPARQTVSELKIFTGRQERCRHVGRRTSSVVGLVRPIAPIGLAGLVERGWRPRTCWGARPGKPLLTAAAGCHPVLSASAPSCRPRRRATLTTAVPAKNLLRIEHSLQRSLVYLLGGLSRARSATTLLLSGAPNPSRRSHEALEFSLFVQTACRRPPSPISHLRLCL